MSAIPKKRILHVLGYKDEDESRYIVHCLDFDIVAEGVTPKEARNNLVDLIFSYVRFAKKKNWEQFMYDPAPKVYWDKFREISRRKRIPPSYFIDPSFFKISKTQIKDLITEKRVPTPV